MVYNGGGGGWGRGWQWVWCDDEYCSFWFGRGCPWLHNVAVVLANGEKVVLQVWVVVIVVVVVVVL